MSADRVVSTSEKPSFISNNISSKFLNWDRTLIMARWFLVAVMAMSSDME
jgi:hypothetical protein